MGERAREVRSDAAPEPVGPYSQAVACGGFLFLSGQVALDPESGALVAGDIEAQCTRVLDNLEAVLGAAGATLADVVRATIYLTDLADFERVNRVYAGRFSQAPAPARATVQVAALPLGARIEIDAIATLPARS